MSGTDDGGAAFPHAPYATDRSNWSDGSQGMTLRDYFAASASEEDIQSMRDAHKRPVPGSDDYLYGSDYIYPSRSECRYLHADTMLAARKEGNK